MLQRGDFWSGMEPRKEQVEIVLDKGKLLLVMNNFVLF